MFLQTPVPTSTTDWCISALMRSSITRRPCVRISVWTCDRRSYVDGSIVWYSSSIPIVRLGFISFAPRDGAWARGASCLRVQQSGPAILARGADGVERARTGELRDGVHDPVQVLLADRMHV